MEEEAPVFLFGMERSGTTLLSMVVGAHPQIAVPFATTGMWFQFHDSLDRYNHLEQAEDVERLVDDVLAHERVRLWDATLTKEEILPECRQGNFGSVVGAVHRAYARAKGKARWANIDIANLDNMHIVNDWFANARFLHIIRDGRDVALSHATMPYGSGNLAECAMAWERRLSLNLRLGHVLGPERYMIIRYEDLILDPMQTAQKMCGFFGVDFDPAMLGYQAMVSEKVPQDRKWLWPGLDKELDASKVGRWRREMSETKRAIFEDIAGHLLKDLGYEAFDRVPRKPARYFLEIIYFLDRGGRWRRLKEKLGLRYVSKLEKAALRRS